MFSGKPLKAETENFLIRSNLHPAQIRDFCGVKVSSIALGTYLGKMDEVTDAKVTAACVAAVEKGCNFFDTAINYRGQRAEKSIGEALKRLFLKKTLRREEVFVSTKAGFVPYEGVPTNDLAKLFDERYVQTGLVKKSDLVAGCHCMEPAYLLDQIERSRKNLGLETIDLFYIHNPETQLEEIPPRVFYEKLEAAFEALERAVSDGKIAGYGLATWNGLRENPSDQTFLDLAKCAELAGKNFRAIQLPFNLAMSEAAYFQNQKVGPENMSAIATAKQLGLSVAVSAPLFQARLCHDLPEQILQAFPSSYSQAECALAFALGTTGVDAAMVGMKEIPHVEHNLASLKKPLLSNDEILDIINKINGK